MLRFDDLPLIPAGFIATLRFQLTSFAGLRMSVQHLPDFEQALALGAGEVDEPMLSECHGVACGLLLRQPGSTVGPYLELLATLEVMPRPQPALQDALAGLLERSTAQLGDRNMGLEIWLPEDESPLQHRTQALGQWCAGFMAALGAGGEQPLNTLSDEGQEALADISEIARADIGAPEDAEQSEEDEQAFAEIVEYLRIAVLILQEDLRAPDTDEAIH